MYKGDISNQSGFTSAWDYRLFLDVKHFPLFRFCIRMNFIWAARRLSKINNMTMVNFESRKRIYEDSVILITHPNLATFFEDIAPTELIEKTHKLGLINCNSLYSSDMTWINAVPPTVGHLVGKQPDKLPKAPKGMWQLLAHFTDLLK